MQLIKQYQERVYYNNNFGDKWQKKFFFLEVFKDNFLYLVYKTNIYIKLMYIFKNIICIYNVEFSIFLNIIFNI